MIPLLRIPPFPGSKVTQLVRAGKGTDESEIILPLLRDAKVGGTFWAAQPAIPAGAVVGCPWDTVSARSMVERATTIDKPFVLWAKDKTVAQQVDTSHIAVVIGDADPWHMSDKASMFWGNFDDERLLIAALAGRAVEGMDGTPYPDAIATLHEYCQQWVHIDPFTTEPVGMAQTIELLAYWRSIIDANRTIAAAAGMAFWKRETVEPLLWNGCSNVHHIASLDALQSLPPDAAVAVWKAKTPPDLLKAIEQRAANNPALLHEVEDGFIRSIGLGADCVPPLSITVDSIGVHFDPAQESALERLLNDADIMPEQLARAAAIRELIVSSGLSKYGVGSGTLDRPGGDKRHLLVPGQVEDDRSVLAARGDVRGNLDLLRRARAAEPDAYIIYRPHPDVDAGHRKGHVSDEAALAYADSIDRGTAISALLDMVDAVHVLSSLAGFEALLRGKDVTCHGTPFYAGWGLTRDLAATPTRRKRRIGINELAAAVLLLYPRYLDPVTGLPCPPEILVRRLVAGVKKESRFIVPLRRLQGKVNRWRFRAGSVEEV